MNLIKTQVDFLKATFFGAPKFPGADAIAENLLITGSCIVAGDGRIWHGNVGNFIVIDSAPGAVGCVKLTLLLVDFLMAPWVQDCLKERARELADEAATLSHEAEALGKLLEFKKSPKEAWTVI